MACRYCGLLSASAAAAREARRLDPAIRTSVMFTHFMRGAWDEAIAADIEDTKFVTTYAWPLVGRSTDAIALIKEVEARPLLPKVRQVVRLNRAAVEGDREEVLRFEGFTFDPEGEFFGARALARVGVPDRAIAMLEQILERGFYCPHILRVDPWLADLRGDPRFAAVLARVEARSAEAEAAYRQAGGERLLGPAN